MGHEIRFADTKKLFQSSNCAEQAVHELLEIRVTAGVLNHEEGLCLCSAWLLVLDLISHEPLSGRCAWSGLESSLE